MTPLRLRTSFPSRTSPWWKQFLKRYVPDQSVVCPCIQFLGIAETCLQKGIFFFLTQSLSGAAFQPVADASGVYFTEWPKHERSLALINPIVYFAWNRARQVACDENSAEKKDKNRKAEETFKDWAHRVGENLTPVRRQAELRLSEQRKALPSDGVHGGWRILPAPGALGPLQRASRQVLFSADTAGHRAPA